MPHRLYGVSRRRRRRAARWWRAQALEEMAAARAAGRLPILCGGTGLYFLSLTEGLSELPPVPAEPRAAARALLAEIGAPALHARLAARDPATAAPLRPGDRQRLARAWEVWTGTGQGARRLAAGGRAYRPGPMATSPPPARPAARGAARPPSPRGSTPCWPAARWRRWRRSAPGASTPRCRRCGRMGCRSCWRIWPAGCRWRRRASGRC